MDSITAARRLAQDVLSACGYRGRREDVLLVVSELVTNAILHGDGPPVLRISGDADRLRVEVSDDGPGLPELREPGPSSGWGLHVVRLLAASWGITGERADGDGEGGAEGKGGKVVWCELAADVVPLHARPAGA
ncbi:ATP-binding protein [Actinomadura sp. ATCC 31491]|uniref:ATP-binding protein n=1 Tax=Actinomadura luzonensis TaxID=2805427 RepID=A0ABT0G4V2_9ACTN|nr:ATP-binding protein [Actinomadura luzonensis]MCK2219136.1 ATP-binding protein [Actinomadura luzonensis]